MRTFEDSLAEGDVTLLHSRASLARARAPTRQRDRPRRMFAVQVFPVFDGDDLLETHSGTIGIVMLE
jgi:hypothetical protein